MAGTRKRADSYFPPEERVRLVRLISNLNIYRLIPKGNYFCDFSRDVFMIFCESDPMGCLRFDIKLDECSTRIEANYTSVPGTNPPF